MVSKEDEQSGNMYNYNDEGSNSNQPPKESAIRRSLGNEDNPYKYNQNDEENEIGRGENGEQNAIRRSLGDKNPNANEFPNYVEKSSEQRFPNLQESHSPFEVHPPVFRQSQQVEVIQPPPPRQPKKFYLLNYLMIAFLQIIFIILIGVCYESDDKNNNFKYLYNFFKDVHLMVFIGFGLLYTALKAHQWSSIGIILFIGTISFEISFFWNYIWDISFNYTNNANIIDYNNNTTKLERKKLNLDTLTKIDYFTSTVLISLGSLIGKLSICQQVVISLFETFFSSLNFYLCFKVMGGIDNGGSIYIHTFGAIFGIFVSIAVFCRNKEYNKISYNPHLISDYNSNIFSFIGSIFLWLFFPSFNISFIQSFYLESGYNLEGLRYRGIINTYLSMIGSAISIFIVSPIVSNGKIKMEHLLNASFVGGVIIGGCCTICSSPWAAILIGFIGGSLSVLGLWYLKKKLKELKFEDTFGILYTFGIPGILGGFLNSIFMANLKNLIKENEENKDKIDKDVLLYNYFNFKNKESNGRDISEQSGIEIAIIFITIGIAGFAGITIGFIIRSMKCEKNEIYFVDSENYVEEENIPLPEWKHPRQDDINLNSSGNKL